MKRKEFVLYGLDKHKEIINKIIEDLNAFDYSFDIKLMLTEALTNAFKHGNSSSEDKPIYLRYNYNGMSIEFEIEDCGRGFEKVVIPDEISSENLLNDCGRGLFIINCIADKIEFKNSTLIIQKYLKVI
ncbi:ATP-binding protein [Tepidibacter thalassicus]|uniref:Serine/threonine-protein kinase RsbW n=1 Tax=Tepidibacter thalassicus DSM 15285 TaxID=1123350 RepID=A0A1M5PMV3_9FIRM|nr:ATP-binding protein [Tepidibacter thalassicus]SHH02533.1 serine/threonine-protein kinase RsbW [Tepidibacter thalassicus DSM 15285]